MAKLLLEAGRRAPRPEAAAIAERQGDIALPSGRLARACARSLRATRVRGVP